MPVHHVNVQPVGHGRDLARRGGEGAVVGRQDRWVYAELTGREHWADTTARGAPRRRQAPRTSAGPGRAPAAHAAKGSGPRPSDWTSTSSSTPAPVATPDPASRPGDPGASASAKGRRRDDEEPPAAVGRPGSPGAHDSGALDGGTGEVEPQFVRRELRRVGRLAGLRHGLRQPPGPVEHLEEERRADPAEAGAQLGGRLRVADHDLPAVVDGTGVEARLERHDTDPGRRVAGEDRPFDRRRATPARQQREMKVHHRQAGQHVRGDDPAEGDDDAERGARPHRLLHALGNRDAELRGDRLHRRRRDAGPAGAPAVRRGDDEHDVVACFDECAQRARRDLRRAEEDEPTHGPLPSDRRKARVRAGSASRPCGRRVRAAR